jgi:hypothetical protein
MAVYPQQLAVLLVCFAVTAVTADLVGVYRTPNKIPVDDEFMKLLLSRPGMPEQLRANFTKENVEAYFEMSNIVRSQLSEVRTRVDAIHHGMSHSMDMGDGTKMSAHQGTRYGEGTDLKGIDLNAIILVGKAAWELVKEGKSTVDTKSDYCGALPKDVSFSQMSHWQDRFWNEPIPQMRYTWHNILGNQVIMTWYWTWRYHGAYLNKGAYVTVATAIPSKIETNWGYHLNARISASDPVNYGTMDYPIAGVTMQLTIDVTNYRGGSERVVHIATLRGDGSGTTM